MIQIDDTLVSFDVVEKFFLCDIAACKGACCVEGDSGAPVEEKEVDELKKVLPEVWNDLSEEAIAVIEKQGVVYTDCEGDLVTSIVNNKDCVFTCYQPDGTCICAIEKAYREGRSSFFKPISCHLYPIRINKYKTFSALNFHKWDICKVAELKGQKENLRVYQFLKEPLIRKYGEKWYKELEKVAHEWLLQIKK